MDGVLWMFEGHDSIDQEVTFLVEWRGLSGDQEEFLRGVQNFQKFDGWTQDPLRQKVISLHKSLQDLDCMQPIC